MVDSMDIYKPLNINIGTVTKNPEMLKFVPDHLKAKRYVPDQYKTQQIFDKAILEKGGKLKFIPD